MHDKSNESKDLGNSDQQRIVALEAEVIRLKVENARLQTKNPIVVVDTIPKSSLQKALDSGIRL